MKVKRTIANGLSRLFDPHRIGILFDLEVHCFEDIDSDDKGVLELKICKKCGEKRALTINGPIGNFDTGYFCMDT